MLVYLHGGPKHGQTIDVAEPEHIDIATHDLEQLYVKAGTDADADIAKVRYHRLYDREAIADLVTRGAPANLPIFVHR